MTRYLPLLERLDQWQAHARTRHPGVIPCTRGCSDCCHGPFDISVADVELVAGAFRQLDPAVRAVVHDRARAQVERMAELAPGWEAPWEIGAIGDARFDRICDALEALPCPMLGSDGGCLIYAERPMICRLMGLGMATESGDVIENGCPIQARFPAYEALPPSPFPLEAWEREERAAKESAADRLLGGPDRSGFETTIAAAVVSAHHPPAV